MESSHGTEHPYEAPKVIALGHIQDLTRHNFESSNIDFSFGGIETLGTS